ncbi:hypothetical protein ANN_25029 [Periplaneta americana]|uniref:Uncharacterized protein n=1 Tax=Periplaneta americana TaxID=6978 RepID=A0ABQ8S098_PERAM|nr:hypothetical protein ANN_25029 [Periplaneta americana]
MLNQSRSSLAYLDLMGNREWEQKTGLFLLKDFHPVSDGIVLVQQMVATVQSNHQLRMHVYTFPELADMVMCYGEARGNGRRTLHMYQQQFQTEITLTTQCLLDFISAFETMGLFVPGALVEGRVDIH